MSKYYIPKYLDEPFRIMIFTVDEFVVTFASLIFVWIFVNDLVGLVVGGATYFFYIKLKRRESSAYFKRALYWTYGMARHLRIMPNRNIKHLKG